MRSHVLLPSLAACLLTSASLLTWGCKAPSEDGPTEPAALTAPLGVWTVASIEGTPVVADSPAYLEFTDDGRLAGNGGVNRLMATYTLQDATLTLSQVASTMMAGPEPLMGQEQRLTAALARVRSSTLEGRTLVLRDAAGRELVRAEPR